MESFSNQINFLKIENSTKKNKFPSNNFSSFFLPKLITRTNFIFTTFLYRVINNQFYFQQRKNHQQTHAHRTPVVRTQSAARETEPELAPVYPISLATLTICSKVVVANARSTAIARLI